MRSSDWSSEVCSSDLLLRQILIALWLVLQPFETNLQRAQIDRHAAPVRIRDRGNESIGKQTRKLCAHVGDRLRPVRGEAVERLAHAECEIEPVHQHVRSEEHTSELQSLMRTSYAVFCLN